MALKNSNLNNCLCTVVLHLQQIFSTWITNYAKSYWFIAFVCPSRYFSFSSPTMSKSFLAANLSVLASAINWAANMLYLSKVIKFFVPSGISKIRLLFLSPMKEALLTFA